MAKKYAEKIKDPRWQKRRLEILERDKWTCQECGDTTTTLHVHHLYYEKGKEPWEAEDNSLTTLCEACHDSKQVIAPCSICSGTDSIVVRARVKGKKMIVYFICPYCGQRMPVSPKVRVPALTMIDIDITSPKIFSVSLVANPTKSDRKNNG